MNEELNMKAGTTLVVGGTGKTGSRVASRLRARGVSVRIGSRSAEIPFDWEDPTTWAPAVRNVQQAYVTYYPDLAFACAAAKVGASANGVWSEPRAGIGP
jgi:nucleoside-diphosphate-sugar epimerase